MVGVWKLEYHLAHVGCNHQQELEKNQFWSMTLTQGQLQDGRQTDLSLSPQVTTVQANRCPITQVNRCQELR